MQTHYRPPSTSLASMPAAPVVETRLEKRVRMDLRSIREAAGVSQEDVALMFGWNRDAISKIERGDRRLRLADFLRIVEFCREAIPDHPAVALAEYYAPTRGRKGVNPYTAPAEDDSE